MNKGKRTLRLERTTIRPLRLAQLVQVVGGTFYASGESAPETNGYNDSELVCTCSAVQNTNINCSA